MTHIRACRALAWYSTFRPILAAATVALCAVLSGGLSAGERTTLDNERGLIFTTPAGGWSKAADVGAYVGLPWTTAFARMTPEALKISQGRFQFLRPEDDKLAGIGGGLGYTRLKQYEARELAAGRGPLWITATYQGKRRPVLWSWSLGFPASGEAPKTPPSQWKQAVAFDDDRYIQYWIHEYVRPVSWGKHYDLRTMWVGADECAFIYGLYGVLDDEGKFRPGVCWDHPFPQNEDQYYAYIQRFFRRVKQLAPDIRIMANMGSMGDPSRFADVWKDIDGTMVEDIFTGNIEDRTGGSRRKNYLRFGYLQWLGQAGKVAILRSRNIERASPDSIRMNYLGYLVSRGDNFFWNPRHPGTYEETPPEEYAELRNLLGVPVGPAYSDQQPGKDIGFRLYRRECQGGLVYLNFTGTPQTVRLPEGRKYYDLQGKPVTQLTIPDGGTDYGSYGHGRRPAWPSISPRIAELVTGPWVITLADATPGTDIRFTLDGTEPSADSPLYHSSITLTKNCVVRAKAFKAGMLPSHESRASYRLVENDPTVQFHLGADRASPFITHNYPLLVLSHPSSKTITVRCVVTGGTAKAGEDFACAGGEVTFGPGEKYRYLGGGREIRIVDDRKQAGDRTIELTLSDPVNATLGLKKSYSYTIQDDDTPAP